MRLLRFLCAALMFAMALFGQGDRGTITGTVSDPAGAVVANAPIQARNTQTGSLFEAASTGTGNYTLPGLPAGSYEVSVTVPGFKKYVRTGLTVEVAATIRVDVVLEVGSASESVTVSEAAPLLKTESGELSHNVTSQRMNELPILGIGQGGAGSSGIRNPNAVLNIIPGAYYTANSEVKVNGAPDNTQALRIEGLDATNSGVPGTPAQSQPSVDAIQEITVQTSNFSAEYGQVGGGFFNVTMKSGGNKFHGSGYDYLVNEAFNAAQPFVNVKPRQRRQDYGFTIGGPVWIPKIYDGHDKTFFFFNWEEFREFSLQNATSQTVPTTAYRGGDFTRALTGRILCTATASATCPAALLDPLGRNILEGQVFDPNTTRLVNGVRVRDPFTGNQVPLARFDPVAIKIQNLIPLPQGPNAASLTLNFLPAFKTDRVTHIPALKIDQNIGSKDKLSFYWSGTNTASAIAVGLGSADGLPDPITTAVGTYVPSYVIRLNYDRSITPTLLLHLGSGYQYVDQGVPSVNTDGTIRNYDVEKELGLKGGITNRFFSPFSGLLAATTGGMKNFGSQSDSHNRTQKPTFTASLTSVQGNHTFKYGAELRLEGYPSQSFGGAGGSYAFSTAQTAQPYWNGQTVSGLSPGFGYASFLLGTVNSTTIGNSTTPRLGKKQLGIFAQDTWKITRKLTLDYGLRYDYSTYLQEQYDRVPFFSGDVMNPTVGRLGAVQFDQTGTGHCNCNLAKNYPWAFGPRLGVAYQLNSKTVVRVGFGVVYNGTSPNNNAGGGLANSTSTVSASTFGDSVTTLAVGIPTSFRPLPWPVIDPGLFPLTRTSTPTTMPAPRIDQNAGRPPRQYQWSVGIQREITKDLAIEAAYVANRGIWWNAPALLNLNALTPDILKANGLDVSSAADRAILSSTLASAGAGRFQNKLPYTGFPTGQTVAQSLRPYPQFTTVSSYWDPLGKTWYDSLQVKATKRMSHGLTVLSTFTWSKSLQLGAERDPNPGSAGNVVTNDVFNRGLNKYLSLHDQPYNFNVSATYLTPRINTNKLVSWVARDWSIGTFVQYASGLPLAVPNSNNNLNSSVFQTTFANRVAGEPLYTVDLNCHCYDPSNTFVLNPKAWTDPAAGQFSSSTAYYSDYRKQRRPSENFNVGRTFRLKEAISLNVRMEFTNIFNRYVVNNPVSSNATQTQARNPNGTTSAGFGFIDRTTQAGGVTPAIVNLAPRSGVLVARITF